MPKIELLDGLKIHYQQLGRGPDLAMIHGIGGHQATWHFNIVPALWNDYRILTYDLRGHGYSEMSESGYTPTDLARDFVELLDALDVQKVDLVGHSFGADIALYVAYYYPERVGNVVLIEALVPVMAKIIMRDDFERADWIATILERLGINIPEDRRLDKDFMLAVAMRMPNKWGPMKDLPRRKAERDDWLETLYTTTTILKDAVEVGELDAEAISRVNVPVHLIYDAGSLMWHRSFVFLRDNLPYVSWSLLNNERGKLAHFAPLERPEVVVQHIRQGLMALEDRPKAVERRQRSRGRSALYKNA